MLVLLLKQIIIGDWKKNLTCLGIGLAGALVLMALLFKLTDLGLHYVLASNVKTNFGDFLIYEFGSIAFMVFVYEFFFRGFVMKYWLEYFDKWSILLQFLFFLTMIIMILKVPYWFYVVYLIFAPFAGWIFYKTKSLVYSFAGQWLFIVFVDATFIAMTVHK